MVFMVIVLAMRVLAFTEPRKANPLTELTVSELKEAYSLVTILPLMLLTIIELREAEL
jgi:hypothetical protein